jgi:sulfoxide reductase heme-binding subunit YedZ
MNRWLTHRAAYPVLLLLCLAPAAWLITATVLDRLGANPAEALLRGTGLWALRFLCLSLAVTPLRQWAGLSALARWRRTLGLTCFGYAALHFLAYTWLDQGFDWPDIGRDLTKRPFALVGFAAFVLLLPLALSSFNRAIRWLGAARWKRLHQLVYVVAALALLHFFWMRAAKHRYSEVLPYALILLGLLAARMAWRWRSQRRLLSA